MSLSSSQAGIVGARRKKLNQTQFSSYRRVKVEHNRPYTFSNGIPRSENSFIARHIYNYNKINNTFTFLGTQKGQSLIRKRTWVDQIIFNGSTPSDLDGTYIRSSISSPYYWKNGIQNTRPYIEHNIDQAWSFYDYVEDVVANLIIDNFSIFVVEQFGVILNPESNTSSRSTVMDNTSLKNINNNKLYSTKEPDLTLPEQIFPDVNFNINTANVFDTKNLAHNEKVFIDIRWTKLTDFGPYTDSDYDHVATVMNDRKGFIYRVGVLIKDNTIDSMLYHTDLATDPNLIRQLQVKKSFIGLLL